VSHAIALTAAPPIARFLAVELRVAHIHVRAVM